MVGQDFLRRNFGIVPKIAWHLDAFGHSASMPKLYEEMGYEAVFFGRMDDSVKTQWIREADLAFNWKPEFEGINGTYQGDGIFSHVFYRTYLAPCGFPLSDNWNQY